MKHDEILCREFVEVVTDYLEGALQDPTLSRVEEHLVMCDWCEDYVGHIQTTVDLLGTLDDKPESPPTALTDAVTRALREAKR
jgi:predicted anti-sigma-YlaC factor YlaD